MSNVPPPYPAGPSASFNAQYANQTPYPGQAPYNGGYPSGPVYVQQTVVTRPVMAVFGHYPMATQCPTCQQQIVTNVRHSSGGGTWLIAFLIFIFGGFLGCCLIPFCVSSCQDALHTCPACQAYIGRRNML